MAKKYITKPEWYSQWQEADTSTRAQMFQSISESDLKDVYKYLSKQYNQQMRRIRASDVGYMINPQSTPQHASDYSGDIRAKTSKLLLQQNNPQIKSKYSIRTFRATEEGVAQRLGIDKEQLRKQSSNLWGIVGRLKEYMELKGLFFPPSDPYEIMQLILERYGDDVPEDVAQIYNDLKDELKALGSRKPKGYNKMSKAKKQQYHASQGRRKSGGYYK